MTQDETSERGKEGKKERNNCKRAWSSVACERERADPHSRLTSSSKTGTGESNVVEQRARRRTAVVRPISEFFFRKVKKYFLVYSFFLFFAGPFFSLPAFLFLRRSHFALSSPVRMTTCSSS